MDLIDTGLGSGNGYSLVAPGGIFLARESGLYTVVRWGAQVVKWQGLAIVDGPEERAETIEQHTILAIAASLWVVDLV
jgi:hypothetical protein